MNKRRDVDDATLTILSEMTVEGNTVLPYPKQLDRDQYQKLNKVLEALGGKWKRGKGHIFATDPSERLEAVIASGSYGLLSVNRFEFFPTPAPIIALMLERAEIQDGMKVLEPSAGEGAIADAIVALGLTHVTLTLVELDEKRAQALGQRYGFGDDNDGGAVYRSNFLEWNSPVGLFDRVVMNPPFSLRQDAKHVLHAYGLLRPGGRLVSVVSAGCGFRMDKLTVGLRALIGACGELEPLPEGSFEESGTGVNTMLVTLVKEA